MPNRKIRHIDLIKDFNRYSGYTAGKCHYCLPNQNGYHYGKWCANLAHAASINAVKNFCEEHWFKCNFCDQKFPAYKTGRIKPRCPCKEAVEYVKSIKERKDIRSISQELITNGMTKLGFRCNWHPSGTGKYTLTIKDQSGFVYDGATLTIRDEDAGKIELGDRDNYYNSIKETLYFTDPEYATKACEILIKRIIRNANRYLILAEDSLNRSSAILDNLRTRMKQVMPEIEDYDQSSLVERWGVLREDVKSLSMYLKDSVPAMKESINGLLEMDLEPH